jgi:hypothetical protein
MTENLTQRRNGANGKTEQPQMDADLRRFGSRFRSRADHGNNFCSNRVFRLFVMNAHKRDATRPAANADLRISAFICGSFFSFFALFCGYSGFYLLTFA